MSDYTPLANNEKDYFMGDGQGAVVTVGKVEQGGDNVNRLVKLSDLAPAESVSDVTVGGTSVVSNGVAAVPAVPSASTLAGTGLTANNGALDVSIPVPSAGTNEHRGDVLTVDNTDQVVWAAPQGGGGGGYTVYNVTKTVSDLTPYEESEQTVYALDINVSNHGIYFLDIQTIDGSADLKTIRAHIPTLTEGDYYDIVIQTQVNDSWAPTYKWKVFVDNGAGGETEMTKIWYYDDYRDEFTTDTELHVFGRHATIMRLEGGAGE